MSVVRKIDDVYQLSDVVECQASGYWRLPESMFSTLFNKLTPFKFQLSKHSLRHILTDDPGNTIIMWTKVKTHHYTGRDDEAFRSLVKIGEGDPVNAINNIPHGELVDDYAFLTAEVIFFCGENNMAVKLFHYMIEATPSAVDESITHIAANALCNLGRYDEALTAPKSVTENPEALITQGKCYNEQGLYPEAEDKLLSALQILCSKRPVEDITDYYGNSLPSVSQFRQRQTHNNMVTRTPEEKLRVINSLTPSSTTATIVLLLAEMYYLQERLDIALTCCTNLIELLDRLYTGEVGVSIPVEAQRLLGQIYFEMKEDKQAEDHFTKALNISYLTNPYFQAVVLKDFSDVYLTRKKYLEGEKLCRRSLAKCTKLRSKMANKNLLPILTAWSQLGICYVNMSRRYHYQAEELLCGFLENIQPPYYFFELQLRTETIFWLSKYFGKKGKLSKAAELSREFLMLHSQCKKRFPDWEKEMKELLSTKQGPV